MMSSRPILIMLLALAMAGCTTRLVGDLEETEANRIISELATHEIPARKARTKSSGKESWSVRVSSQDAQAARRITETLGLPRPPTSGMADLLEHSSIVPSASQERLRESMARGHEIASSIEKLHGVVEASVHIAVPAEDLHRGDDEDRIEPTASVVVRHGREPDVTEQQVRELVAGAVPGIEPDRVTVVFSHVEPPRVSSRQWEMLGPFQVARGARTPLAVILAVMAVLNLLLGAWVVLSVLRARRAAARNREPGPGPAVPDAGQ